MTTMICMKLLRHELMSLGERKLGSNTDPPSQQIPALMDIPLEDRPEVSFQHVFLMQNSVSLKEDNSLSYCFYNFHLFM